jgi:putative ABC transport system substrate-binding protein
MRRREFIAGLGTAAAACSLAARAQRAAIPLVGYMGAGQLAETNLAAFRQGLREVGFIEGQNIAVEYRFAEFRRDLLPEIAADFVRRHVSVIAATGGVPLAAAAKAATSTIPIVFEIGTDPVQAGLVARLNRPGGNITGVNSTIADLWPKLFDLMAKIRPRSRVFGIMFTGIDPNLMEQVRRDAKPAADAIGRRVFFVAASTPQEIDAAFLTLAQQGVEALVVTASSLALAARVQLAVLAARYGIPAVYTFRNNVEAGGLMSYGIKIEESVRLVGEYVGRIIKGERPGDVPIVQPTRYQFAINLKTAKALGLDIPPDVLALADEVIE